MSSVFEKYLSSPAGSVSYRTIKRLLLLLWVFTLHCACTWIIKNADNTFYWDEANIKGYNSL